MQENLSKFYSWVDKNIEIRLGRQRCCHLSFVWNLYQCRTYLSEGETSRTDEQGIKGHSIIGNSQKLQGLLWDVKYEG